MITIEVIEDCKKGKNKAQRKLFDFFADHMFNVCMRYMNNTEEAEDMMSQGFAKVFKSIQNLEYRDINSLRAWIKKIMINESLMQLRKSVNFSLVSIDEAEDMSYRDHNLGKMEAGYILLALNELPLGYKTILNLYTYYFDEFSFGAGYLIKNEGRDFMRDTYKAFFSVIPNNSFVRLKAEIYFTDNFKKVFPGINLSAKLYGKTYLFKSRRH